MEEHELELLLRMGRRNRPAQSNRNDILVGATAELLDLYRVSIDKGEQTKAE